MRLLRATAALYLLRTSRWCQDRAERILDRIHARQRAVATRHRPTGPLVAGRTP